MREMKKFKRLLSCVVAAAMIAGMLVSLPSVFADSPTTLTVDPSQNETETNFKTIRAAVAKAKEINPQSADAMVTINVKPGDYEEQVMIANAKFITLQQTPGTEGKVDLHWYYCTGYCAGDCDLDGKYNPKVNWNDERTWKGYKDSDPDFPEYKVGQLLNAEKAGLANNGNVSATFKQSHGNVKVETISYYDTDGVAHENVKVNTAHLGDFVDQAALCINNSSDIVVNDINVVNSIPVMVTEGEKRVGVAPQEERTHENATAYILPRRDNLTVCAESTEMATSDAIDAAFAKSADTQKVAALEALSGLTAQNSAYLARSDKYNERGHAIATKGSDKITFNKVRARGNQDSVYINGGRLYFKECDLIGGTDYIYGDATAVFDTCLLGAEGMSNKSYGATITAANHEAANPYGYLFYNCTLYNVLDNITTSSLGRPWRQDAQITFYNLAVDDAHTIGKSAAGVSDTGWADMSGAEAAKARFFEYGTHNKSDSKPVNTSKRLVNKSKEEGGQGMGSVLNEWQILEFNPYNYFNSDYWLTGKNKDNWDPMNFSAKLTKVTSAIKSVNLNIPSNEETEVTLPTAPEGVTYKWESNSPNVQVSADGKKITVTRPAAGADDIVSSIILYAMDNDTKVGDKVELPVTITPTTDTTNVFNIPVKITSSLTLREDNDFTITISKNGAPIKTQVVTLKAGQTEATATIENVPASAEGIDYDVKIVSKSNDLSIASPEDGVTTVKGIKGQDVELNISAQMLVDDTVDLSSINCKNTDGNQVFDLISLAKAAGAEDSIANSDVITVEYKLNVPEKITAGNLTYFDLVSGTPTETASNAKNDSRFVLAMFRHWNQLDIADCTRGIEGNAHASASENHQFQNVSGNFDPANPDHIITVTIDYKNKTVKLDGKGTKTTSQTFAGFPSNVQKGDLKLAVYTDKSQKFTLSDVKVTYKKVVTGELSETPEGEGEYTFTDVVGGNLCTDSESYKFVDGVDENVAALFASSADKTVMDSKFTANYKNYVGGTGDKGTHPTITLNADKGKYRIYYVGYNHGKNVQAKVNGKTYTAGTGKQLAARSSDANYVLKYYEIDIEMTSKNSTITFDSTEQWLPDTYCVAVVGSAELGGTEPTPTPTASTEPSSSPTASTEPSSSPTASTEPSSSPTATTNPTPTPTESAAPADSYKIESAKFDESGKLTVKYTATGAAKLIAVTYKDNSCSAITNVKMFDISTSDEQTFDYSKPASGVTKVFIWQGTDNIMPLSNAASIDGGTAPTPTPTVTPTPTPTATITPSGDTISVDFTKLQTVPVYSKETGNGFVSTSGAIRATGSERKVAATSEIKIDANGASVTESNGTYLYNKSNSDDGDDYNYGGLIYRQDVAPGAYHLEVEVADASNTTVAPNGMQASRIIGTSNWDNCLHVPRTVSAKWAGNVWTYDFATGENFVEIEIEPNKLPTKDAAQTVGVKSIKITPLAVNPAGDKPTIHILGDSTQKAYSFNETIGSWGQMLGEYFDPAKVTVINYSMGGRAMKSNYNEGRTMEPLITGKAGDFVFIHSAHNDETLSSNRFSRGSGIKNGTLTTNNASYQRWLDMYVKMIKARGMTPVLVTAMPRTGSGQYKEDKNTKPNGFNPDSPGLMREKAKSDAGVGLVDLYAGAKTYIDSLEDNEVLYIYHTYEAGETPANNNANGSEGMKHDGTHYREAAAKQWCRIMLQSIYDQSVATTDTYTDKAMMAELVNYMKAPVKEAAADSNHDWSNVFPEMASDVSAVGVVPGATKQKETNYYYRNNIEKALQIGALHKDKDNNFKPTQTITVGEFARGVEKVFGLSENSLSDYSKTYAELTASGAKQIGTASFEATSDIASVDESVETADATGDLTVTVSQPAEGGTVTAYNETQRMVKTADVPSGLKEEQVISDNEYFKFIAPPNLVNKSDSNGKFSNKEISTNYVEFRKSGSDQPPLKTVTYEAKKTGALVIYASAAKNKSIVLENTKDGTQQTRHIDENDTVSTTNACATLTYDVQEGETYLLYTSGGTGKLFGISYEGEYPQSTTSLKANSGDKIRVTASAEDGYTLNSILVGGSAQATTREYTFTITADTTVSAKFDKEPELVEHTMIASDAALTREAMGAILYDAYTKANAANGKWITNAKIYMSQKGGALSPDDPNYDPNITYNGGTYLPLTGWGALTDTDSINTALYAKVKQAYNLGLMRTEEGIVRGDMKNGTKIQPKTEVTRAKAAKALVFCYILGQLPTDENHLIYMENQADKTVADIAAPNSEAPTTVFGE